MQREGKFHSTFLDVHDRGTIEPVPNKGQMLLTSPSSPSPTERALFSAANASRATAFEPRRARSTCDGDTGVASSSTGSELIAAAETTSSGGGCPEMRPVGETGVAAAPDEMERSAVADMAHDQDDIVGVVWVKLEYLVSFIGGGRSRPCGTRQKFDVHLHESKGRI